MNLRMSNKNNPEQNTKPRLWRGFCLLILSVLFVSSDYFNSEMRFPATLFQKNSTEFFDGDSMHFQYDGTGAETINRIYKVLIDNPSIIIEISAHCSSEENNPDALAKRRGDKVKELLIKKGIDPIRVIPKGYGAKKLKITDLTIAKVKTKTEKEALRQVNRRAVFRILSWDYPVPEQPKYKPKISPEEEIDSIPGK